MSRKNIYFYIAIICFAFISNCFAGSDLPYKEGELLVRFAPKADGKQKTVQEHNQILSSLNAGEVKHSFKRVRGLTLVKLPENLKVADALPKLRGKCEILYVEPNYKIKLLFTPNDTRFSELWGLHNTGQNGGTPDADIDAPEAWDIVRDACDIIVAVLDTGVDYTHPDLAANMWKNQAELNGTTGVDDDNNGYIDDINGYDFGGYTPQDQDNDPMDDYGHGTHCAGIIGAVGNNGIGVTGVCWNTKIMALKIFPPYSLNEWEALVSNAVEAIDYAVDNGAKVLNASWTIANNSSQALKDTIEDADANGVLFIAAAGNFQPGTPWLDNDVTPVYPANYDCNNIISVMATNHNDKQAGYSHYGAMTVDLAAPGGQMDDEGDPHGILSTVPGNAYEFYCGTSMAAPYVAGACALLWSYKPYLTHNEVKEGILESVDVLPSLENAPYYGRLCQTGGRLNLYKALDYKPHRFSLVMDNNDLNNGCVDPNVHKNLTFDIYWDVNGYPDTNMVVIDYLPYELDYNNLSTPPGGDYNSVDRTVKWNIIGNSGHIVLRTNVTQWAAPGEIISNNAVMEGNNYRNRTSCQVSTCFWDGKIIYVDRDANDANGFNNGTNWKDAYNDLQDALTAARNSSGYITAIWVAAGTYKPVNDVNISGYQSKSFELPDNVALIGHFGGKGTYETSPCQRNFNDANNETILEGRIGQNYSDGGRKKVEFIRKICLTKDGLGL